MIISSLIHYWTKMPVKYLHVNLACRETFRPSQLYITLGQIRLILNGMNEIYIAKVHTGTYLGCSQFWTPLLHVGLIWCFKILSIDYGFQNCKQGENMLIFKKRWSFTDLFNCKWRGLLFLPSVIRKEVKCSMPFHRALNY